MSDPLNSPASAFGKSPDGCPSLSLTLWADAWLRGAAAPDDVIDAMAPWAPMHLVTAADEASAHRTDTPWPHVEDQGLPTLLRILRESRGERRNGDAHLTLTLPVPGDVRGLPAGSALARDATAAGEAMVVHTGTRHTLPGPTRLVGIVPVVEGPDVLRWVVHALDHDVAPLPTAATLGEAEYAMRNAVRGAAEALTRLGMPESSPSADDPRTVVADLMARAGVHRYPDDLPNRALRVLDSAAHVAAILTVAGRGADRSGAGGELQREQVLRPLWDSVRDARLSAVTAGLSAPGTSGFDAAS